MKKILVADNFKVGDKIKNIIIKEDTTRSLYGIFTIKNITEDSIVIQCYNQKPYPPYPRNLIYTEVTI